MTDEIRDFTPQRDNPRFRIGEDVFIAVLDLPTFSALEFMGIANQNAKLKDPDPEVQRELLQKMFFLVLLPDSARLFISRLSDVENPIGILTMNNIIEWLMETYGLRPTEQLPDSVPGSVDRESGKELTENVPVTELTSSNYPSTNF